MGWELGRLRWPEPGRAGTHATTCPDPSTPRLHQFISLGFLQTFRLFLNTGSGGVVPERLFLVPTHPFMPAYCKYDVNTVWPHTDFLFLGLLSKWPGRCYLCWCVGLRGRSQKARDVSVLFFVKNWDCHLWVLLLLCFLVCFDVFGVLLFGNHAISLRAVDLLINQSSKERR